MATIGDPVLYSVNDIIGKTLIAKKLLNAYNLPYDNDPNKKLLFQISPGSSVGVVDTYFNPKENRKNTWWGFYTNVSGKKNFYYVEHKVGNFDVSALQQQGVPTVEQQTNANLPWDEKLTKLLKTAFNYGLIIAGVVIVAKFIDSKKNK
jgi:hypothetical protein